MSYLVSQIFNKFTRSGNKKSMSLKHRKPVHHTSTASCTTFTGVTGPPDDPFLALELLKYSSFYFK